MDKKLKDKLLDWTFYAMLIFVGVVFIIGAYQAYGLPNG